MDQAVISYIIVCNMNGHEFDLDDSDLLESDDILSIICNTPHDILWIDNEEFNEDAGTQSGQSGTQTGQTGPHTGHMGHAFTLLGPSDKLTGDPVKSTGHPVTHNEQFVTHNGHSILLTRDPITHTGHSITDTQHPITHIRHPITDTGHSIKDRLHPITHTGHSMIHAGHLITHTEQPTPQPDTHKGHHGHTTEPMTVPCPICSELTTNHLHYGGVSCISCKAFFRRAVTNKEKKEERCRSGNGSCNLKLDRRNNCPSCRYQSCLLTGMQPDLVLSGKAAALKHTSIHKKRKRKHSEEVTKQNSALAEIMENNRLIISRVPGLNLFTVETDVIDEVEKRLRSVQLDPGLISQDVIFVAQLEHALLVAKECVGFFTELFTPEKILQSREEGFCPAFIFTSVQEYFVQLVVLFLKSCSHFQSLTWSCQARLLRKNLADVFILLITMCFDKKKQLFRWGLGGRDLNTIKQWREGGISHVVEIDRDTLTRYTTNKIGQDIFQVVNFLVDMELPNHILMIMMLIIIFARDGMMMEKQHKVDLARSFYLKLLYRYVKTTNPSHQASKFTASLHRALKTVKDVAEKIKAYEVVSAQRFVIKT